MTNAVVTPGMRWSRDLKWSNKITCCSGVTRPPAALRDGCGPFLRCLLDENKRTKSQTLAHQVAAAAITGNTNRRKHRKSSVNDGDADGEFFKGAQW